MVKFGETIEMDRRPEWIDGYVDYAGLKALLKKMEAAGTIREFSEHTVYKAFSVASDSNLLQCHAPREVDFTKKIDTEIAKVNKFADGLRKQLLARFDLAQHQHEAWIEAGSNEAGLAALNQVMLECSEALQNFEDFININYLAFSKILKKHDKLSSCPCRAPYLLRIQRETFARQCLPELIKGISDLHASLVVRSSQPGTPEQTREDSTPEDAEKKKKKGGVFDSAQKGGTTFIRSTRKYWVATADVLKVKTFLLRRLPVYKRSRLPVYKFTDGATDSDLVTSIYFDSPGRQLYEGRLKKFDGAIALRVRWYGPTPAHDDIVYMERKVHRE
ncbi:vacuolar transporter chaperone 4, partial [Chrysochromulina tobinii]